MFVHLHCHSHYSFLRAVNPPEEIIAAALELRMPAVALTDSNGMYAAVPFYEAARAAKVKPIVGVVLDVEWGETAREGIVQVAKESLRHAARRGNGQNAELNKRQFEGNAIGREVRMVLLAADMEGYSNLCQLTTLRHLGALRLGQKETFAENEGRAVTIAELATHSAGVLALCPMEEMWRNEFAQNLAMKKGEEIRAFDESSCNYLVSGNYATSDYTKGGHAQSDCATNGFAKGAYATLARLKTIFADRLYIEVQHLSPGDGRFLREAERIGGALGIPLVATNNVHFLKPEEHLHHRAVNAIRTNTLLTTVRAEYSNPPYGKFADRQGRPEITSKEAWFKSGQEMQKLFPDHPALLRNTLQIVERCSLELELRKLIFPVFPVPQDESPFSYLWKLSFEGAQKRYRPLRPQVLARLTHELEVIEKLSLAPYFLLVWDIVEEANRRGIPAVARGSAASSMVAYCLGISCVCPLRWDLYFERFLNEQRGDCPDIDIDICGARRDELLDYVYERWGAEHVAMIGSFITMHARLAVREIAKVFGVPPGEVNYFTKRLPRRPVREIVEAIKNLPECRDLPVNDEPWKTILQVALRLDDAPRHLGIHPCGTVISARPLTLLTPLERATKGIVVTQYDMNAVEALGLIKMDLLGQRGFTTMSLALDNIDRASQPAEKHKVAADGVTPQPKARRIDFSAIPENDPETCEVIAAGRTMGIFQIESPGMRGLLRSMKARTLEEVAIALALIRPGAAEYGSKELFLKRLRGHEAVQFAHESLKPILGDTLGICIYQEQVMQIAQAVGSMSLAEADLVRRSAAKFSGQRERERLRGKFLKAAEKMGLQGEEREETWMMVEKFAGFGFCKAHAATYADISYRMAYLKTHHATQFLAAMCSAGAGFYHVSAYVEEAKRWGIAVRLPSVNYSRMEYTAEPESGEWETSRSALRIGLMQVRGLRVETISALAHSREEQGLFRSLEDFLVRVPVERDEIEALIKCGAFDDLCERSRPAMLWQWNLLQTKWRERGKLPAAYADNSAAGARVLFAEMERDDSVELALRELPMAGYTREQKVRYEREILEVCVSGHPLDFLPRNGESWSDELPRLQGKRVTLCGWVVTYRHVSTKNYRNMMFVTLEDQRGLYEVILFPDAYDKYGGLVYETRAMRVTGMVQEGEHINGEKLEKLKSA